MIKVLIAGDHRESAAALTDLGLEVVAAADGAEAWDRLQADPSIGVAILDWTMPDAEGPEFCRRIRAHEALGPMHVLLLVAPDHRQHLVAALESGADDYLITPFGAEELRARVHIGMRVRRVRETLRERARELQVAASCITQLSGLLPICSYCKQIRTDHDYWEQLEDYLGHHTALQFSHAICPTCFDTAVDGVTR